MAPAPFISQVRGLQGGDMKGDATTAHPEEAEDNIPAVKQVF